MEKILKEIGLTDSECKVYLALLELGDSTRSAIVDTSGVAGSKVYELLNKLQEKGFVSSYLKNQVKHFKPLHPDQIMLYLEKKRNEITQLEKEAKISLPMLLAKYAQSKDTEEVEILEGLPGLELIFREQVKSMKKGETCYVIGGTRGSNEEAINAFFEKIHVMRKEKGIKTKILFNERQKKESAVRFSSRSYKDTETRYFPHSAPVAINVWNKTTVLIIFGEKTTSIRITSASVAKSFKEYFELMWKTAKNTN